MQVAELPGDSILAWKVLQDPVNGIDPQGLVPGDTFPTIDAAAIDAVTYGKTRPKQFIEHGGFVFPVKMATHTTIKAATLETLS